MKLRWVPRYEGIANHMLDATYYAIAAAWAMGMQNLSEFRPERETEYIEVPQKPQGQAPYAIPAQQNTLGFKQMKW